MNKRFGILTIFLFIFAVLFVSITQKVDDFEDYSPTIIIETGKFYNFSKPNIFNEEETVIGEFHAKHDNLGIVSVKFNTHDKVNDNYLQFSIKEKGQNKWFYSGKYKTDQFVNDQYFPFGFPKVEDSEGKIYQIEIKSLNKLKNNSVEVVKIAPFLSKYNYGKEYLLQNKEELPRFLFKKIKSCLNYFDSFTYFILLTILFFLVLTKLKINKKISKIFTKVLFFLKTNTNKIFLKNKKNEFLFVLIIYVLLTILLSQILFNRNSKSQYGDTTFAAQIIQNIGENFKFESSFAKSIVFSFGNVWYKKASEVCDQSLSVPIKFPPWGHFYFIAFPLGLISRFFNIFWFIAFSHAVIYSSILLFVYIVARKFKINIINTILLILITLQHPLWYQGFYGQFYFNRFFLLFCSVIIILLLSEKLNYFLITIFSLLAISTNEIYGIALFMIYLIYLIYFKRDKKIFFLSIFSFFLSIFLIFIIQRTAESNLTQNSLISSMVSGGLFGIIKNFLKVIFSYESGIFLLINLAFGGFFILFKPKLLIAWIFLLLPNLMIYIGKLGWSTHYHVSYLIPSLWLSIYAISLFKFKKNILLTLILFIFLIIVVRFNVSSIKIGKPDYVLNKIYFEYKTFLGEKKNTVNRFNTLRSLVDKKDRISLPEAFAYPFVDHEIFYYPTNIDSVNKVVFLFDKNKTGDNRFSSINYGHQDENLDKCILLRMRKNNFDLDNPIIFENLAIISKK